MSTETGAVVEKDQRDVAERVAEVTWYHSIELPGGIVTPGEYDLRAVVDRALMPASLAGRRCLDVGTHDGFWAFTMERQGAQEVVAIDLEDPARLDWPLPAPEMSSELRQHLADRRRAFWIAHQALGSSVDRKDLSVYDLSPDVVGTFDFAFIGTLLQHLRDPVGALMAVRRVVTGELLISTVFSPSETILHPRRGRAEILDIDGPFWTASNLAGLKRQASSAGWSVVRWGRPYFQPYGSGWHMPPLFLNRKALSSVPRQLLLRLGALHISLLVRPVR
jgi:tRNA (mo5U34)-methyltransferase